MPVPDRPGVLAEVTTLAGRRGVNIVDLDISHGPTGGVLLMVVPAAGADAIVTGLDELGYRPTRREVGGLGGDDRAARRRRGPASRTRPGRAKAVAGPVAGSGRQIDLASGVV